MCSFFREEIKACGNLIERNELMRLGRTTLKDLISECTKKFKFENNLKITLSDIIREIGEISGNGEKAEVMLKEEYKRSMPSFGVRIHFQTNKKNL